MSSEHNPTKENSSTGVLSLALSSILFCQIQTYNNTITFLFILQYCVRGTMVSNMLASNVVEHGFESCLRQSKDYKIGVQSNLY